MPGQYYRMVFKSQKEVKSKLSKFAEEAQKIARSITNKEKAHIKGSFLELKKL